LSADGKWRWVKHIPNALVVNTGDALEFLTGGFYKPTIHRVVQPPEDQRGYPRLGMFYFGGPDDAVVLSPVSGSPVLEKAGVKLRPGLSLEDPLTMERWLKGRIAAYGQTELKPGTKAGQEQEVINGIVVTHFK